MSRQIEIWEVWNHSWAFPKIGMGLRNILNIEILIYNSLYTQYDKTGVWVKKIDWKTQSDDFKDCALHSFPKISKYKYLGTNAYQ